MRAPRTLAIGAAAVALFAGGWIAMMWALGRGPEIPWATAARRRAEPVPPATVEAPTGTWPAAPLAGTLHPTPGSSATPPAGASPVPEDADPSWKRVPVALGLRDFGPLAAEVDQGFNAAREQMTHCFDAYAGPPPEVDPSDNTPPPAMLVLYLESRAGFIDVVDVVVESLGTSSPSLVSCCRDVLRGHEMPASRAMAGQRYRVKYPLY